MRETPSHTSAPRFVNGFGSAKIIHDSKICASTEVIAHATILHVQVGLKHLRNKSFL